MSETKKRKVFIEVTETDPEKRKELLERLLNSPFRTSNPPFKRIEKNSPEEPKEIVFSNPPFDENDKEV